MYNLGVKSLAQQIEEFRVKHGIEKSDMAEMLGAETYQHYYMWMKRDSIPKTHIDRAKAILAQDGEIRAIDAELLSKFSQLPEDQAENLLRMIDALLGTPESD